MNYLDLAAKIALSDNTSSNNKHFLLGCVALREDGAIVTAINIRTHLQNVAAHAEYRALKKAGLGSTIWVARVDHSGNWRMAKPCRHCMTLLKNKRVKKVYYTIGPNEYGAIKF